MKTLRQAAQALCDRWDTPLWKDGAPMAVFIGELRDAIAREEAQTVEPSADVAQDWTHAARERAGYEEGWSDCMTLWANHMERMSNALGSKPAQASYKIKELK